MSDVDASSLTQPQLVTALTSLQRDFQTLSVKWAKAKDLLAKVSEQNGALRDALRRERERSDTLQAQYEQQKASTDQGSTVDVTPAVTTARSDEDEATARAAPSLALEAAAASLAEQLEAERAARAQDRLAAAAAVATERAAAEARIAEAAAEAALVSQLQADLASVRSERERLARTEALAVQQVARLQTELEAEREARAADRASGDVAVAGRSTLDDGEAGTPFLLSGVMASGPGGVARTALWDAWLTARRNRTVSLWVSSCGLLTCLLLMLFLTLRETEPTPD